MSTDHSAALAALVGQVAGPPSVALDLVNEPMIRHWAEAMGDENPVYQSDAAAREVGLPGLIAPPTMLQAWSMVGLKGTLERDALRAAGVTKGEENANDQVMRLLDEEGYTSVVATNCDQDYVRPLVPGERICVQLVIEAVSDVKTTGLGTGRFLTNRYDFYVVGDDFPTEPAARADAIAAAELVGSMRFRILKFAPDPKAPAKPPRPLPAITEDTAYYWEGLKDGRLLIQRCTSCGALRHPSLPGCGTCGSLEWDSVESAGNGTIYSYVIVHYPQVPAFDYPLPIGLIELDEGTRIVANLDMEPGDVTIGLRVTARIETFDDDLSLPVFSPAAS